jgi:predicted phosphate transport protein (TIGR00153 family)
MRTIARLFGHSPFVPLQSHMEKVAECVDKVRELLAAFVEARHDVIPGLAREISDLEHVADQVKHDIQNHLPRTLFLPVDKGRLLEILAIQDNLADKCENIGVLLTLKQLDVSDRLRVPFTEFVAKNIAAFGKVRLVIQEIDELLATSFGGAEAEKVQRMVHDVAFAEHEADRLQHALLRELFASEDELSVAAFHVWNKLIEQISELSNLSERLANRVRTTLELK